MEAILYEQCILIAVTILLILWSVWLKCKTCYGEETVNKLSLKPFKYACFALTVRLIAIIVKIFLVAWWMCVFETCSLDDGFDGLDAINFVNVVNILITWLSWTSFALFGGSLCMEHYFYWYFVTY